MGNFMQLKRQKILIEKKDGQLITFLYRNFLGRLLLKIISAPIISNIVAKILNSRLSIFFIKGFVKKNNIHLSEYEDKKYISYNDFFARKIKNAYRPINENKSAFISPCDSKLSVYKINEASVFKIKNSLYKLEDLLNDKKLASRYKDGYCLIFRLCVDDYHRYCYIDSGTKGKNKVIKGKLYTVRPIALENYNIYKENSREYTILKTNNFGSIIQIEVGATLVGKIKNHHQKYKFSKGEEKGLFEFGGSTIVLLVEKDKVKLEKEILNNTKNGYETVVKYGEKIGIKI